jgi:hypothetical protein
MDGHGSFDWLMMVSDVEPFTRIEDWTGSNSKGKRSLWPFALFCFTQNPGQSGCDDCALKRPGANSCGASILNVDVYPNRSLAKGIARSWILHAHSKLE